MVGWESAEEQRWLKRLHVRMGVCVMEESDVEKDDLGRLGRKRDGGGRVKREDMVGQVLRAD